MTDADTQTVKLFVITHLADDVLEAVMAAVTAAQFEAGDARRQIQLVMGDEDRFHRDLEKLG